MTENPVITVKNVSKNFGATQALDDVSFEIPRNSICGLLGANGAGKTTLMSAIAGHDRTTQGQIQVLGERPFDSRTVARATCFIHDSQRYPDDYKLFHVLRISRHFHENWDPAFAEELSDLFSLPRKTQIRKFSRGQLSALAIVLTLAARTPITIFDEPYLGLDVTSRHRFYDLLIKDYASHPRTILISTHLVGEMEKIFDRAIIMNSGKVIFDKDIDELRSTATEISGHDTTVTNFIQNQTVLTSQSLGSLRKTLIEGTLSETEITLAKESNLNVAPVSLQDLVAAVEATHTNAPTALQEEAA